MCYMMPSRKFSLLNFLKLSSQSSSSRKSQEAVPRPLGAQEAVRQPLDAQEAVPRPLDALEAVRRPLDALEAVRRPLDAREAVRQPLDAQEATKSMWCHFYLAAVRPRMCYMMPSRKFSLLNFLKLSSQSSSS